MNSDEKVVHKLNAFEFIIHINLIHGVSNTKCRVKDERMKLLLRQHFAELYFEAYI